MNKPFYLTTPLYYVNARPHVGHAYTTIVADCLARWHRQHGEDVFLLTGTDEHGEKIAQAAQAKGISPRLFADETSKTFKTLWEKLGISYDFFIRTTDETHQKVVQNVLQHLQDKKLLEKGIYTFWYCVPCETNYGLNEIDRSKPVCPTCQRPVSEMEEEDYFLPLKKHQAWLKNHIEQNPTFILPPTRRNEVLALLEDPLPDLCVTRPKDRIPWGIEVPFSPTHVTYVWFDALLNYISALGWPDGEKFHTYWERAGAVHLIGKDILRHHALYWPIILHALGVSPPRTIYAHGWWLVKGEKISKSKGNIVDPEAVVSKYGLDTLRYFLLRDVPFGEDGLFSEEALIKRMNADLANDLGNLVYRTLTMIEKHAGGRIPPAPSIDLSLVERISKTQQSIVASLSSSRIAPSEALKAIWELIHWANDSVEKTAPWTLAREGRREELSSFLYRLAETLRVTALFLWPFMPGTAASIWRQLGIDRPIEKEWFPAALKGPSVPEAQAIRKENPLFPRLAVDSEG